MHGLEVRMWVWGPACRDQNSRYFPQSLCSSLYFLGQGLSPEVTDLVSLATQFTPGIIPSSISKRWDCRWGRWTSLLPASGVSNSSHHGCKGSTLFIEQTFEVKFLFVEDVSICRTHGQTLQSFSPPSLPCTDYLASISYDCSVFGTIKKTPLAKSGEEQLPGTHKVLVQSPASQHKKESKLKHINYSCFQARETRFDSAT